jgi:hypothetical protein
MPDNDWGHVVRIAGRPPIKQFIYRKWEPGETADEHVFDLFQAWLSGKYTCDKIASQTEKESQHVFDISNQSPNLTFSGWQSIRRSGWVAAIGFSVQFFVNTMAGFITFHYNLVKPTRPYSRLVGIVLFSLGKICRP